MKRKDRFNDAVSVEMWYLSKNKKFRSDVKQLREKYHINLSKNSKKRHIPLSSNQERIKEEQEFQDDFFEIYKNCRFSHSKRELETIYTLKHYILHQKIKIYGYSVIPLPNYKIQQIMDTFFITFSLDYDTTKSELEKMLDHAWKKISKERKEIGGGFLRDSKVFRHEAKIWELYYEQNMLPKKIERKLSTTKQAYSVNEIEKIVKWMDKKIESSYRNN